MQVRVITVQGGNLFALAARYLGDATQAVRIAQRNGMSDYFFTDLRTLVMPPVDASGSGGVPAQ